MSPARKKSPALRLPQSVMSICLVTLAAAGLTRPEPLPAAEGITVTPVPMPAPVPPATSTSTTPTTGATDTHMKKGGRVANDDWTTMAPPLEDGPFLRAQDKPNAQPLWGLKNGLRVGLYPLRGPRGLLRIFAPDLQLPEGKVINFIAVEPLTVGGKGRGLSELEPSPLDNNEPGLRFWSADKPDDTAPRLPEDHPARGVISKEGEVQILTVYVFMENYKSGAKVYVRLTFRTDRPEEIGIATFAQKDSAKLDSCVASSTMGNFARLRKLYLSDSIVSSKELWPKFDTDGFAGHEHWGVDKMFKRKDGSLLVCAANDETAPQKVTEGFPAKAWEYSGKTATQYWRVEKPDPKLIVQVNGRYTYYGSKSPVPGGIAFENFEMLTPFKDGAEFWFGVTTQTPQELMKH